MCVEKVTQLYVFYFFNICFFETSLHSSLLVVYVIFMCFCIWFNNDC